MFFSLFEYPLSTFLESSIESDQTLIIQIFFFAYIMNLNLYWTYIIHIDIGRAAYETNLIWKKFSKTVPFIPYFMNIMVFFISLDIWSLRYSFKTNIWIVLQGPD